MAPELVRLFVASIWIERPAERELQTNGFRALATRALLCCDQVVKFLEERQIGSLVVVKVETEISTDLSESLLTGQDGFLPKQILALLFLHLLISLHVNAWRSWVGKGRGELVGCIYRLGHGNRRVHIGGNVGWELLAALLVQLQGLELLILVVVHDCGAWCYAISGPHSKLIS